MSFAAVQARVNAAVLRRLADVTFTFTPAGDAARPGIPGLFHADYAELVDGMVSGSAPAVECSAAAVADWVEGSTVLVNGTLYRAVEPQPDGTGMTVLRLREEG